MRRPVLAVLVAATILGGLKCYMTYRPRPAAAAWQYTPAKAEGEYSLDITLSFDAGPDEFALDANDSPSLVVRHHGAEVLTRRDAVHAGHAVTIPKVEGLTVGPNEFYIEANPVDVASPVARALRLRVLRNGSELSEASLWSEPGDVLRGTVTVMIPDWANLPNNAEPESTGTAAASGEHAHE